MAKRLDPSARRWAAPFVAAGILVALMLSGGSAAISDEQTEQYHETVGALIDGIPVKIGPWIGKDVEAPPAAVKILRPNRLLQRRYVNPATGRSFSLLVVHCGDVRDMQGHYPPQCYPAHGWEQLGSRDVAVALSGSAFPAKEYDFRRTTDGFEQRMNVIGFFVVPDGNVEIVSTYEGLMSAARRRTRAGLGAAQIQLVSGGDMDAAERRQIAEEFVEAIAPVIRVIAGGVRRD